MAATRGALSAEQELLLIEATPNAQPNTDPAMVDMAANILANEVLRLREQLRWVPVAERLPKVGKKVQVCGRWKNENRWGAVARWFPAGTLDASMWDDPPEDWWDGAGDNCRNPSDGWWEEPVAGELLWELDDVTHWRPLDLPEGGGA